MNGHPENPTDNKKENGDQDDNRCVPTQVVLEFIVRGQLEKRTTKETPREETLFGSADPGLGVKEI